MKVLLESPEFFRTPGPETNGIFPSCFQTFSLSPTPSPPPPLAQQKKEGGRGGEGRADRFELSLVTRYLRMSEVFHGCVDSALRGIRRSIDR